VKDFNDPFELFPRYDKLLTEQIEEGTRKAFAFFPPSMPNDWKEFKKKSNPLARQFIEEGLDIVPQQLLRDFNENLGIVSFTENLTSLLMWAHYAWP
jgi:hypothetical protein